MTLWELIKDAVYITRDFWYMLAAIGVVYLVSYFAFGG